MDMGALNEWATGLQNTGKTALGLDQNSEFLAR
jgi:hypothetical protein